MSRQRKLSESQLASAAVDRRSGLSWAKLSQKYEVAVNTLRTRLAEYSDEFDPITPVLRSDLETELAAAKLEIEKIKHSLKKRFNLHI